MFEKSVLRNGLRVLTTRMAHTRSVTVALFVGAGSRYEEDKLAGVSHLLEHMCFKGTERRPTPKAISETIEGVGGLINASTNHEVTIYWCKVARPYLPMAVDLLADMTRRPLLHEEELRKEKQVVLEELAASNEIPSFRADALIDDLMWPNQPLGRDIGGSKESVNGLDRQTVVDYWAHQYTPTNIVASVAGDVSQSEAVELIEKELGDWQGEPSLPLFPAKENQDQPAIKVERWPGDQAHICVGLKGLPSNHPDKYTLTLLNTILGEGMSSRLFQILREDYGLAYDVHSSVHNLLDCGALVVYAGVTPKKTEQALSIILRELRRLKEGIPEEELNKGKQFTRGRLLLRMEDTRSVAGWMGAQELLQGHVLTVDDVLEKIDAVTEENSRAVAQRLFLREKLSVAVVGPFRGQNTERKLQALLNL